MGHNTIQGRSILITLSYCLQGFPYHRKA
uniref:Uncharacterized protein n=1 Tax=Anguilla anguilla TaxID=7936 RepID=A0A0E9RH38_ANGAN